MKTSGRSRVEHQAEFEFKSWGGVRAGAGRKSKGERPLVSHRPREALASRFPVHVTLRLRKGLASLRRAAVRRVIEGVIAAASERFGTRLVHYSVQSNHLHVLVESEDRRALSRAMQGFAVRLAKALNRFWNRKGKVFADRYYDRILRTPREVRNALAYVLRNHAHHGIALVGLDPFASGRWFDGWAEAPEPTEPASHLARAKTWLLRIGWKRWGLVPFAEVPQRAK